MKRTGEISIEQLRLLVRLDADSGRLYWLPRDVSLFAGCKHPTQSCNTWNSRFAGKEAFAHSTGNGYLHGCLFGVKVLAHRVVWALHHGEWPAATVDHIDGSRTNNRPVNLRDVRHQENCRNQPRSRANTSGVTGVSFDKGRGEYEAYIHIEGRKHSLGRHSTHEAAAAARAAASKDAGYHQNHGRSKT